MLGGKTAPCLVLRNKMVSDCVLQGMIKASMMKEALASCQIEDIGKDLTLEDLYLEELKQTKKECKKR